MALQSVPCRKGLIAAFNSALERLFARVSSFVDLTKTRWRLVSLIKPFLFLFVSLDESRESPAGESDHTAGRSVQDVTLGSYTSRSCPFSLKVCLIHLLRANLDMSRLSRSTSVSHQRGRPLITLKKSVQETKMTKGLEKFKATRFSHERVELTHYFRI